MDKKMMKPKEVSFYADRISVVGDDLIRSLNKCRGDDFIIPNIEREINKYTAECKSASIFTIYR